MAVRADWSDDMLPQIMDKLVELGLIQSPVREGMPEHSKSKSLDLQGVPKSLSREELFNVLLSPFVENERPCIAYARSKAGMGLDEWAITRLKGDVAIHCLPTSSKVSSMIIRTGSILIRLYCISGQTVKTALRG
jgi:hypothetical protein